MTVAGSLHTGIGASPSFVWDGKDGGGKVVEPGSYSATLTAQTADGKCSDSRTINFEVVPAPDDQCGLLVTFGSTANMASGNLSHSQELFSAGSGSLATSITLYYNSLDGYAGPLGTGWSHSYDIAVKQNGDGSVVLRKGNGGRKLYKLSNGAYVSQPGDTSVLTKAADGTFVLTHKDGTKYQFGQDGRIASIVDLNSHTMTFVHTSTQTTITDGNGRVTTLSYDANGHISSVTAPNGAVYTFTYSGGLLSSVTYPGGGTWGYSYDAKGFMLSKTDPQGGVITYTYDANNRVVSSTDTEGKTRTVSYPQGGSGVQATSFTEKDGGVWQYQYDTDKGVLYAYGASGCTTCGGGTDKLASVTDANGNVTSYEYDLSGRLVKEIDPLGNITTFTYDAKGNLAARTDGRGYTTTYAYDQAGRLLTKKPTGWNGDLVTFTYASDGKILTAQTIPFYSTWGFPYYVKYTYTYDAAGRIASVTDSYGKTISYQYDAAGNRTKMTAPDGKITTYAYDANNRLTTLTSPSGTFSFVYDSLGRRTKLTYPNKVVTTYGYDAAGRLASLATKTSNGATIKSYSYTYDKAGNRISKAEPSINYTYTYDSLDRLLKSLASVSTRNEEYSYDGVGNRLSGPKTTTLYTYGGANELLSDGVYTYQYDKNGNMASRSQSGVVDYFSFYDDNRLRRNKVYDFYNDAFGRRLAWNDGNTLTFSRVYLYDGDNILYEDGLNGTTSYTTRYTHNLGVDDVLAMERGGVHYYYHKDDLGSVTAITDSKGGVVQTYDYDSFGNIVAQKSTTFVQPYTYTAREWDKETGLYYYRARYYDPMEGRFIQKDPIGFEGGINLYAYVQNNPINRIDPYGLQQQIVNTVGGVPIVVDTDTGRVTMGPKDNYVDPMTAAARDAINRSKDTVKDVCSNVAQEKASRTLTEKAPAAFRPFVKWGSGIVGTIVDVLSPTDAW